MPKWTRRLRRQWMVSGYEPWSAEMKEALVRTSGGRVTIDSLARGRQPLGNDQYFWCKESAEDFATSLRAELAQNPDNDRVIVEVSRRW